MNFQRIFVSKFFVMCRRKIDLLHYRNDEGIPVGVVTEIVVGSVRNQSSESNR